MQDNVLTVPLFHTETCCTQNTPKTKVRSVVNIFGIAKPRTWSLRTWELWYWARVKMGPVLTSQYGPKKIKAITMICRRKWPNITRDIRTETAAVFRDKLVATDSPHIGVESKSYLRTVVVIGLHYFCTRCSLLATHFCILSSGDTKYKMSVEH